MEHVTIEKIVSQLQLEPHPEGGYYKETYRSEAIITEESLSDKFEGDRNYSTAIYFLLTSENFSAFHRIKQDEVWHYYNGSSLYVHVITPDGIYNRYSVGMKLDQGELPQLVVPAGCWFASSVKNENDFSLVGCTVAPGFDFRDFELADRENLSKMYPDHQDVINKLTRCEK